MAGFTLLELAVVTGLILFFVSFIGVVLSSRGEDQALKAGQQLADSMLMATRDLAMLKGTNTRIIIHYNSHEPDKYLRLMGIIFEEYPDSGSWKSVDNGSYLPMGVYFHTEFSTWTDAQIMNYEFPHLDFYEGGSGGKWLFFEFTQTGLSSHPGARFIIGTGRLETVGTENYKVDYNANTIGGFIIWKYGGMSSFSGPEAIKG